MDYEPIPAVESDFAKLEARFLAAIAGPRSGDLHKIRAADIFGVPVEEVTQEQRYYAKRWHYLDNYSAGPEAFRRLADQPNMALVNRWSSRRVWWRRALTAAGKFWDRLASMVTRPCC